MKAIIDIQSELKAPKGQENKFGGYRYRSCEDILEALKPLLAKHKAFVTLSDEMTEVGGRVYVKATATMTCGQESASVTAYAREAESRKGMDDAQVTGAASSYARKYALNGLFAIDDTKDADATNDHGKGPRSVSDPVADRINAAHSLPALKGVWDSLTKAQHAKYADLKEQRKAELEKAA